MQTASIFDGVRLRAVCDAEKRCAMASYHLSVKAISRSAGRSATGAAAYRAGEQIVDERTGVIHDYTRRTGVEKTFLVVPEGAPVWAHDRAALWNAAEQSEKRKNSTVAREFEVALPVELSADERRALVEGVAKELMTRHGIAVDVCIHEPHKDGDQRNHHAHILTSTRRLGAEGFGEKARELDDQKSGEVVYWRERWAVLQNEALERCGQSVRVDHRSLEAQAEQVMPHKQGEAEAAEREEGREAASPLVREAIQGKERDTDAEGVSSSELPPPPPARLPTIHLGPKAMAMERKAQRKAKKDGVPLAEPVTRRAQWNQARLKENQQREVRWQAWLVEQVQRVKKKAQEMWQSVREGMHEVKQAFQQQRTQESVLAQGMADFRAEMTAMKQAKEQERRRESYSRKNDKGHER